MNFNGKSHSDVSLWRACLEGDHEAFAVIYRIHSKNIFQYGSKLTKDNELIKDTIQELFIELWNFRKKRSDIHHLKTYLLKAFRYKVMRKLKKELTIENLDNNDHATQRSPETEWILEEVYREHTFILRHLISSLPDRQREVIHLKFFQGLGIKQIAEILHINKQSVSNLLNRALISLRKDFLKKNSA